MTFREEKRSIEGALSLVESELSLLLFEKISPLLSDKGYWHALGFAYTCSDCTDNYSIEDKRMFFTSNRFHREYLMNAQERRYFKSLPDVVTIYRGMTIIELESGEYGLSWSLSKKVAEYFAYKYVRYAKYLNEKKTVHSITVEKHQIIAYFSGRKEREIIYNNLPGDDLPF